MSGHVVYIALDRDMNVLYVGSTSTLRRRLAWHEDESPWFVDTYRLIQHPCPDKATRLAEERRLIAKHNPPWNWQGRTTPNPMPRPTREECHALLAERRAFPAYRETAEWQLRREWCEAVEAGLQLAQPA